jgi:hypothetical protein
MEEMRNVGILFGKPDWKRYFQNTWEDDIKTYSKIKVTRHGLDSSGSGPCPINFCCEHSNENSGSIKYGDSTS